MAVGLSAPPFGTTVPGNQWSRMASAARPPGRTVSVVVAHYEQPAQLARTLDALRRQTLPVDQVVVADDGSARPPQPGAGVTVVSQPDLGFRAAAARNLAVRECTSDLLVFLDADTTPEPAYVERLTHLPALLPELLAVGRRRHARLTAAPGGALVEEAGPRHELDEPAWLRRGYLETDDLRRADATGFRFVLSAALACSRWWFNEIDGFDETFVGYGGEDWELAHRSWLQGGLVAHVPDAVAWHDGPAAGESGRRDETDAAELAQTLAVAQRVGAPGATFRGLLLGPPDLVVTTGADLDRRALTMTLDSLLAGLPRARVALDPERAEWFAGDPRIHEGSAAPAAPADAGDPVAWLDALYRLHLHLIAPAVGATSAWAQLIPLLDSPEPPASTTILAADGPPVGTLHDLRQHRRARRWAGRAGELLGDLTGEPAQARIPLRSATDLSLQAWLEGWG